MKAIILAAGKSSRLYPLTLAMPKCLLQVGGKRIIDHQIDALRAVGISDIVVVVGHQKKAIMDALGDAVRYRAYENFANTNNLHTLWNVRDELTTDCFILFSDVLFPHDLLTLLKKRNDHFCTLVDTNRVREGTMRVTCDADRLSGIGGHIPPHEGNGNFVGVAKISADGAKEFIDAMEGLVANGRNPNDYYTLAFDALAKKGTKIAYQKTGDHYWAEVDTPDDLVRAREVFAKKFIEES